MLSQEKLREDLWKMISAHYEKGDYTEAVRDAVFCANELLRDKSGIEDRDGTKLVESALLGSNPSIKINKNETTTEKDIQQGIAFSLKGIMQYVKNPLSHEKTFFTQDDSEVIISYINYLLNRIDNSGGKTKIDDIMELLLDEDFTGTKEYAELLIKEIPNKKRYNLLLELYEQRDCLPQNRLSYFIKELFNSLSKIEQNDFCKNVSISLMKCKDDDFLRMYFHYFMDITYENIDKLAQLRIEDLIIRSISAGRIIDERSSKCNSEGSLATWITTHLSLLSNKKAIINSLLSNAKRSSSYKAYVFKYFSHVLVAYISLYSDWQISDIKSSLESGDADFCRAFEEMIEIWEDDETINIFGESYFKGKEIIKQKEEELAEIPF